MDKEIPFSEMDDAELGRIFKGFINGIGADKVSEDILTRTHILSVLQLAINSQERPYIITVENAAWRKTGEPLGDWEIEVRRKS